MVENIVVPLDEYDLAGFIDAYRTFYATYSEAEFADQSIPMLREHAGIPENDYGERDPLAELLSGEWKLFFQMHEPLVDDDALCIDGERRDSDDFDIGESDAYGFLVEVIDGNVHLQPALYDGSSGPFPSITLQGTCSVVEDAMRTFAERFRRVGGS